MTPPSRFMPMGAIVAIVYCLVSNTAYSQQADPCAALTNNSPAIQTTDATDYSLAEFETRLKALETAAEKEAEEKEEKEKKKADEPQWIDICNRKWTNKFGGRMMGDYVLFASQNAASRAAYGNLENYFEMRRLRFFMSGKGYGVYDYEFEVDFEPEPGRVAMKDMYVGIHEIPIFGYVRMGNFKEPFSLEELTSSNYITFLERSLPVVLWAPARHVGITAYRHSQNENATLAYGAFFNDISQTEKERIGDRQGADFAIRATWLPYYGCDGRALMHVGGGYVYRNDRDQVCDFESRPEVHEGQRFVRTGDLDLRAFQTTNLELAMVNGPLSVQSELFYTHTDGTRGTRDMNFYGAYVYASYFLTGEHRPYKRKTGIFDRVKPSTNFWIVPTCQGARAGWGAWELAARYSYVDLQNRTLTDDRRGQLHDMTVGANWYWNSHTRLMFNWIHAFGALDVYGLTGTDILSMRLQVDF